MKEFTEEQKKAMDEYKKPFINSLNSMDITAVLNLTKAKNNTYICPICQSGSGKNGTGAQITKNKRRITCFAGGCFGAKGEDNLGALKTLSNKTEDAILKEYFPEYEITAALKGEIPKVQIVEEVHQEEKIQEEPDNRAYYKSCMAQIEEPAALEYLAKRGISLTTAKKCRIGFDAAADPAQSGYTTSRLIIPTSASHYVARRIDEVKEYSKLNNKGGKPGIFNKKALYEDDTIFVVEGAFDAMAIIEAGAAAIALNSINQVEKLIEVLKAEPTTATLIICFDNEAEPDKQAKVDKAAETLKTGLQGLNIDYISADITGKYKDANEALTSDKTAFISAVQAAKKQTASKPDNIGDYLEYSFTGDIIKFRENREIKTGFTNLDGKIGSLYPGLYAIGAVSSLGKTTFTHQMADQIAASGQDVLFFSMEQSIFELVSKSIARNTAKKDINTASTALEIRKGNWNKQRNTAEDIKKEAILTAAADYQKQIGDKISIIQGDFNCNIDFIKGKIERYIRKNNTKPVVIIDYLQAMIMGKETNNTRGEIDSIVIDLKRLSRDKDIVIIVISSFNRTNYLTPVDFESFKESGGIDYTSDVVWGLQLQAVGEANATETGKQGGKYEKTIATKRDILRQAKAETPRKIELVCLKNRYGISSYKIGFKYYSKYDLFEVDQSYIEE